jgi:hypothetical protein
MLCYPIIKNIIAHISKIPELLAIIFAKNNCASDQKRATKKNKVFFFFLAVSDWFSQLFFAKIIT